MNIFATVFCVVVMIILSFALIGCSKPEIFIKEYIIGKNIKEDDIKEFYFTRSSTAYPPEFQRYVFSVEDGKHFFYHEQREGETVFLTEEDITVNGKMELSDEDWNVFLEYMKQGSVHERSEDINSGGDGPWLYLYWDGDKGEIQEFEFENYGTVLSLEEFCSGLKIIQLGE